MVMFTRKWLAERARRETWAEAGTDVTLRPLLRKQAAGMQASETGRGCICKRQVRHRTQAALSAVTRQVLHHSSAACCWRLA
jgi:hypothetical protein